VSKQDGLWFGAVGALVWGAATLFYVAFARGVIEQAFWFYALNAVLVAAATAMFFQLTARLRHLPRRRRVIAALIYAAPGVLGACALAVNFAKLLPAMPPESVGRYATLVIVAYALLIAQAMEKPAPKRA
jgi:hypothetical protein